jgi:thiol-disulfide isomerase/thioredoxin
MSLFHSLRGAATSSLAVEGEFPSLEGANGWLNSEPLTPAGLRGHVVLVDFTTYTCINWLRTLPYVRAWAERYKDQGVVAIAVQTPEFEFEKDVDNVRKSIEAMKIDFPIAIDNDYTIWSAFNNNYWPALYIIDAQGQIRHHHFGEGGYEESESVIQRLLREAGHEDVPDDPVAVTPQGIEVQADWPDLKSPETYLGYARTDGFASPGDPVPNQGHVYDAPPQLRLNEWALSGNWTVRSDASVLHDADGRLLYRFHARDVNLVIGPAVRGESVRFRVSIDGQPPGAGHGVDVDEQGNGTVVEQRLYQLIRQTDAIADRTFEMTFLDPGAEAYCFTFG